MIRSYTTLTYFLYAYMFLAFGNNMLQAQGDRQGVFQSAGGTGSNASYQMHWSVGEPVIFTGSNSQNVITHGFIQPNDECPSDTTTVLGTQVCIGAIAKVRIPKSQFGVDYQAFINANPLGSTITGTGGSIQLNVPTLSLLVGNYTIQVKATGFACSPITLLDTASIKINQGPNLSKTISDLTICQGSNAVIDLQGSETGILYKIFLNGNQISTATGNGSNLTSNLLSSNLSLSKNYLTASAQGGACPVAYLADTGFVLVKKIPKSSISVFGDAICGLNDASGSLYFDTLQAGVNYSILLNTTVLKSFTGIALPSIQNIPSSSLKQGTNTFTIKANNGVCPDVSFLQTPAIILRDSAGKMPSIGSNGTLICQGADVTLFAKEGFPRYQWYLNQIALPNSNTFRITTNTAGIYTVLGIDSSRCYTESESLTLTSSSLTAPNKPLISKTVGVFTCEPQTPLLSISNTYTQYQWRADGYKIVGATQFQYQTIVSGVYTVEVFNAQNCSNISDTIRILPSPTAPAPLVNVYRRFNLDFSGYTDTLLESSVSATKYQWYVGKRAIVNATNKKYKPLFNASYALAVTYSNGCRMFSNPYLVNSSEYEDIVRQNFDLTDTTILIESPQTDKPQIQIYPNPTQGKASLYYGNVRGSSIQAQLLTLEGKIVWESILLASNGSVSKELAWLSLPPGLYVLRLQDQNWVSDVKITLLP